MTYTTYSLNPDKEKTQFIILCISCFCIICISKFSLIISSSSLLFTTFMYVLTKRDLNRRYFVINFTENQVEIDFVKRNENITINYSDIVQITYERYKARRYNKLTYFQNAQIKKVTFLTVADQDEYINFLKWIREKNINTKFDAYPPDEQMEFKIQETFGLKYRKFIKDSL